MLATQEKGARTRGAPGLTLGAYAVCGAHIGADLTDTTMLPLDKLLIGSSRTRSTDSYVTDSASGATAFSCGIKTYNAAIAGTTSLTFAPRVISRFTPPLPKRFLVSHAQPLPQGVSLRIPACMRPSPDRCSCFAVLCSEPGRPAVRHGP